MPRDLFGDVTRPSISIGNRKWYTVPVSLVSHSAIVLAVIAIPLLAPAVMPSVLADDTLTLIKIELPKPPSLPPRQQPNRDVPPPSGQPPAPVAAPDGFQPERPPVEVGWENQAGVGTVQGNFDTVVAGPPPEVKLPPEPVRVGGTIRRPMKLRGADPVYNPTALAARIQGIVIIEATLGADGRVMNARILRSLHMLDQAALDAVRTWEYTPTLLNGVPVPVIMTVTVTFTLSR